jgi:N-acetylmuramoyl-L-alanine amidase CwlA
MKVMEITKVNCPSNKVSIKCPYSMSPTRIVVHNTANDASAMSEISYMLGNSNYTSFHYAVDDYRVVQGIEENRNSFNAGDGANGKGNREGISIEICYSKSGGDRFTNAEQNAVHLIVDILRRYGWGIDKVTKHQDYSGKYCPHRTLDMGWQRFLNMISAELNPAPIPTPPETYILITNVPAYTNSTNAKNGVNSTAVYTQGEYFIFNKAVGMINITKTIGKAGGWINPADNVIKVVEQPVPTPVEPEPTPDVPVQPETPVEPEVPTQPTEPETPVEPEIPVIPVTPTESNKTGLIQIIVKAVLDAILKIIEIIFKGGK